MLRAWILNPLGFEPFGEYAEAEAVAVAGPALSEPVPRDRGLSSRHDLRLPILGMLYHDRGRGQRLHEGHNFAGNMLPGDVVAFVAYMLVSRGVRRLGRTDGPGAVVLVVAAGYSCTAYVAAAARLAWLGLRPVLSW